MKIKQDAFWDTRRTKSRTNEALHKIENILRASPKLRISNKVTYNSIANGTAKANPLLILIGENMLTRYALLLPGIANLQMIRQTIQIPFF